MSPPRHTPLLSLAKNPYSYPSPEEEDVDVEEVEEAVKHFRRLQASVQKLETKYLHLCTTATSTKQERDLARKRCVDNQESLDELRVQYRKAFPQCRAFMAENEVSNGCTPIDGDKEIQFMPNAQDFVEAMEADLKGIAAVIKCDDWTRLLPKALDDLERAWDAAERTSQPVGLTWTEVRNAIVQKYHCAPK